MKLASLKQGGRDGTLVVVSKDLKSAVEVRDIAPTLQAALDGWQRLEGALESVYEALNLGTAMNAFAFDQGAAHSPLPRAYQWCEGSVWISHLERCRKSTNRELPQSLYTEIGMYQGGSDSFVPPHSPMICPDEQWDPDLEAGICAITDDVPMSTTPEAAAAHIKLILLVNDFSLRRLQPPEMAKGLGVLQCKPANAFTPVAVSPASLGDAWTGRMLARRVLVTVRGETLGGLRAMWTIFYDLPQLVSHLAKTRNIVAGSIIGAGTVSNYDPSVGHACLMERRAVEILEQGGAKTPYLRYGDEIRIDCLADDGSSIFGAIVQTLAPPA